MCKGETTVRKWAEEKVLLLTAKEEEVKTRKEVVRDSSAPGKRQQNICDFAGRQESRIICHWAKTLDTSVIFLDSTVLAEEAGACS